MINQFDNNGTTFTGVEEVGTNQFKLTLSGVDDDVCTQLKATVGSNTIIQEVGDKCAYLTFNNDLSKGTTSSNTGTGGSGQQETPTNPCKGFTATACTINCTNNNGTAVYTYAEEGTSCAADGTSACDGNGVCNACPSNSYALSHGGVESNQETNKPGCYCVLNAVWCGARLDLCALGGFCPARR